MTVVARYRRRTTVDAPLSTVWDFQTRIGGLRAVTPDWMDLRVESVEAPDGEAGGDRLGPGTSVHLSVRPFGLGPRQTWTSTIVGWERGDDVAWFRDEMTGGPFPRWVHTHRVEAAGEATVLTDLVEYRLPLVPAVLSPVGRSFFEPLFAYRHRRTRRLLEARSPDPAGTTEDP